MPDAATARWDADFLVEIGSRLSGSLNVRRCAQITAELAVPRLADAAVVLLRTADGRVGWLRAVAGRPRPEEGRVPVGVADAVPCLGEALAGLPGSPCRPDPADVPDWLLPPAFGKTTALVVMTLPGNAGPVGALLIARRADRGEADGAALTLIRALALRAGAAIAAAVLFQEQSTINAILTADLMPPPLPRADGVEFAGSLRASQQAGQIGGDFYEAHPVDGEVLLALGDVCGKGAEAAVLAGRVRHGLRALVLVENRPEQLLGLLNRTLLDAPGPCRLVTAVLAVVRPDARRGRVVVELAVAGHPPPLILRGDGSVEEVEASGTLLGLLEEVEVPTVRVELAPGEVCLLYSDGITEAFGGPLGRQMFGEQRLKDALATCPGMPARALVERLEQLSTEWLAYGERDDRTLLAIRATPDATP